ncbi:hypothetical protein OU798_13250 [Prolixibacteraceae bacterium Z1-6]|uniref:Uncharacterized protein n=1 Tax=Draconibacterium aestuarii TaxID=2998507 RepID=A0A9X3F6S5_9BACT|nr:hypothetical protein [Prolixibacteraceae bacterium Z1-6]
MSKKLFVFYCIIVPAPDQTGVHGIHDITVYIFLGASIDKLFNSENIYITAR